MNPGSSPCPRTGRGATAVRRIATVVAAGVTRPPAPRPRWLVRGRVDLVAVADVIVALICLAATRSTRPRFSHRGRGAGGLVTPAATTVAIRRTAVAPRPVLGLGLEPGFIGPA